MAEAPAGTRRAGRLVSRGLDRAEHEALTLRLLAIRQAKVAALGLLLSLVPIVLAWKSLEHTHKLVRKGLNAITPGVEILGGIGVGILILIGVLLACWALGRLVTRTMFGARWRAWERTRFLGRSPVLQKYAKELTETPETSEEHSCARSTEVRRTDACTGVRSGSGR